MNTLYSNGCWLGIVKTTDRPACVAQFDCTDQIDVVALVLVLACPPTASQRMMHSASAAEGRCTDHNALPCIGGPKRASAVSGDTLQATIRELTDGEREGEESTEREERGGEA